MPSLLEAFKEDSYRVGDCQALIYDRKNTAQFPEGYLGNIYFRLKGDRYSRRRPNGSGILNTLFCGFTDTSFDAVVSYLANRPLVIIGVWEDGKFREAGFCFPVSLVGVSPERSCFAGYAFFREWWSNPVTEVLAMLGLSTLFVELNVNAIHGQRYQENSLTAKFMRRFGFEDCGTMKRAIMKDGKLVGATVSSLMREDFEAYCERELLKAYAEKADQPSLFTP